MRIRLRSGGRGVKTAVAMAVMIAVLTVLIAPSIDMPETVLREHHVAAHSMTSGTSGTLIVVGIISLADASYNDSVHLIESSRVFGFASSQPSPVLRC